MGEYVESIRVKVKLHKLQWNQIKVATFHSVFLCICSVYSDLRHKIIKFTNVASYTACYTE